MGEVLVKLGYLTEDELGIDGLPPLPPPPISLPVEVKRLLGVLNNPDATDEVKARVRAMLAAVGDLVDVREHGEKKGST